ncbi:hypothetical protein SLS62_003605 [Diatrype stigma]|uniref:Protein kinase domain-containing protein n=1 Tax=Diatrype stigma TaxID=117547 RepID=A0AAN9UW50_9PEZI
MSSTGSSIPSPNPEDMGEDNLEEFPGNGLILERAPFGLEMLHDYEPGGHHPVHLRDLINGRYRIMHKLGSGGLANVWLCRDIQDSGLKYVALKILLAEASTPDYGEFHLTELGNVVALGLFDSEDPDGVLKRICLKVTKALGFLHRRDICHGVYPVRWRNVDSRHISLEPCLIDLGESFKTSAPPKDLGIPGPYRSPEVILKKTAGVGSDLWALGCTLFEIRTGRKIFNVFDDEDDDYLDAMVQVLGPLPEPWWSTTWQRRKAIYRDTPDSQGRAVAIMSNPNWAEGLGTTHPSVAEGARSLQETLAPGLWYMSEESRDVIHRDISPSEIDMFAGLLGRLLQYRPEDRISAQEVSCSDYFRGANVKSE